MRSNNPVFTRSEEFNRASSNAYGNQTYAGGGQDYPGYGETDTGAPQVDQRPDDGRLGRPEAPRSRSCSSSPRAFATWWWIGDVTDDRRPRPGLHAGHARRRRRVPPVAGQLVQARDQPGRS